MAGLWLGDFDRRFPARGYKAEILQSGFLGSEANVVGRGAGDDEDLQTTGGGKVEHGLQGLDAVPVAVGEGVVKDDG